MMIKPNVHDDEEGGVRFYSDRQYHHVGRSIEKYFLVPLLLESDYQIVRLSEGQVYLDKS